MSLANKYRPKSFDDVIGQDHIVSILRAKIQQDAHKNHNYLFFWPRGTGKTSLARLFAKAINADQLDDHGNPLPDDPKVQAIDQESTLDYVEIDAASHTGVDNIREEILSKVDYPPTLLRKKVYVIDEVHQLSKHAFNALLKTMEEPRPHLVFILATTEIHKVPDTIISRCQVFSFNRVPENLLVSRLSQISSAENFPTTPEALGMIAGLADGCVRDAVKYLDQVSILGEITPQTVSQILGVASDQLISDLLAAIQSGDESAIFAVLDQARSQTVDFAQFARQILGHIDQNFSTNPHFFAPLADAISRVHGDLRFAPYPDLIFKLHLHNFLATQNPGEIPTKNAPTNFWNSSGNPAPARANSPQNSQENLSEKGEKPKIEKSKNQESPQNSSTNFWNSPETFSTPPTENSTENSATDSWNLDQTPRKNPDENPEKTPQKTADKTPPETFAKNISEKSSENSSVENPSTNSQNPSGNLETSPASEISAPESSSASSEFSPADIKTKILAGLGPVPLAEQIKKFCDIRPTGTQSFEIVAINKFAEITLKKQDSADKISQIVTEQFGPTRTRSLVFVNKDQFFDSLQAG